MCGGRCCVRCVMRSLKKKSSRPNWLLSLSVVKVPLTFFFFFFFFSHFRTYTLSASSHGSPRGPAALLASSAVRPQPLRARCELASTVITTLIPFCLASICVRWCLHMRSVSAMCGKVGGTGCVRCWVLWLPVTHPRVTGMTNRSLMSKFSKGSLKFRSELWVRLDPYRSIKIFPPGVRLEGILGAVMSPWKQQDKVWILSLKHHP